MAEITRTILQVNGVWIPDPSGLQWGLQSVSDQNAGRTTDGKMHVNLITRKRKLELQWNGVDFATASEILRAVNPETFNVTYLDALTNTRLTKEFYVGDRTAPVYSYTDGYRWYSNVSFNIIEV
jgi:hypothetical protein